MHFWNSKIWPQICSKFETSLGIDFFRGLTFSFENLYVIIPNISNQPKNKNSQSDSLTVSIRSLNFDVKITDCRSPPRLPASYHCSRITLHLGNSPVLRVTRLTVYRATSVTWKTKVLMRTTNTCRQIFLWCEAPSFAAQVSGGPPAWFSGFTSNRDFWRNFELNIFNYIDQCSEEKYTF